MERLEARFPVNPKSSGLITINLPGLVLSMHVRYDRKQGILQFNQIAAIESLARSKVVIDLKQRRLPISQISRDAKAFTS